MSTPFCFGISLLAGRILLLSLLYFTETPSGGAIVEDWTRFFPHTVAVEAGVIAALTLLAMFIGQAMRKVPRIGRLIAGGIGVLYLTAAAADDQVMRWLGQHLSLSYLKTYGGVAADLDLVGKIFEGGALHFLVGTGVVVGWLIWFATQKKGGWSASHSPRQLQMTGGVLLAITLAGLTSPHWFAPSKMRWKRIRPVPFSIAEELNYNRTHREQPVDFAEGIRFLGGDPEKEYPFWNPVPQSDSIYASFRNRPFEEKPDIILLTVETLRGWSVDLRTEDHCRRLPRLCDFAEKGVYFPHSYSVGYPSIEGLLGIQAGIWSHPEKTFLSDRPSVAMETLPDIFKKAGYHRIVLTATEPSFDNLHPWFAKWYDYAEYRPENNNDIPLALRFEELYRSRPDSVPLHINWMSTTTHIPFTLPAEWGPDPDDYEERYLRTLTYLDSALGIVFETLENSPRRDQTVIVLTGDHAIPNSGQKQREEELGATHEGYTWVPLLFVGPGVPEGEVRSAPASHIDIAPTLLSLLRLPVSNHFPGVDLINEERNRPAISFRNGEVAARGGNLLILTDLDGDHPRFFSPQNGPHGDTAHPVEGFISGQQLSPEEKQIKEAQMVSAAARAWGYLVDHDRILPRLIEK